jgi:SAM-dependent methyltransferase
MSAFVPDVPQATVNPVDAVLTLTGERTIPGLDVENYWFRRHEVVYQRLAPRCAEREVLEAGCGEGYGADLIAGVARRVIALDYDETTVAYVRARYPRVEIMHGNLAELPLADSSVDVVVNFQVIEHLWDQAGFVGECARVLRPAGLLMMSTPNRITFSPGRDTPINPFHTRELNADELTQLLVDAGFALDAMYGVFHGPRLAQMDARHGGSIIDAQIARAVADAPWPADLLADVAAVTTADFDIVEASDDRDGRDIDDSLDLIAIAVHP